MAIFILDLIYDFFSKNIEKKQFCQIFFSSSGNLLSKKGKKNLTDLAFWMTEQKMAQAQLGNGLFHGHNFASSPPPGKGRKKTAAGTALCHPGVNNARRGKADKKGRRACRTVSGKTANAQRLPVFF